MIPEATLAHYDQDFDARISRAESADSCLLSENIGFETYDEDGDDAIKGMLKHPECPCARDSEAP